jgi:hypothetical protein
MSLHKLAKLKRASVKLNLSQGCHLLRFCRHKVAVEFFEPLKQSLAVKIEAQRTLDMLFTADSGNNGHQASPYLMIVLAMVCQVKVSKYSESVVQRGEIPKGLHLIIEGEAQVVYDDAVYRELQPSRYCREMQRPPTPPPFKFGVESPDPQIRQVRAAIREVRAARKGRCHDEVFHSKKIKEKALKRYNVVQLKKAEAPGEQHHKMGNTEKNGLKANQSPQQDATDRHTRQAEHETIAR